MSCCGSQRAALRTPRSALSQTVASPAPSPASDRVVRIRYAHDGAIVVRGGATGRLYRFAAHEALEVDAVDARALIAGGRFVEVQPRIAAP